MLPEDKLALTFAVLCAVTVGAGLSLAYLFGYAYYCFLHIVCFKLVHPLLLSLPLEKGSFLLKALANEGFSWQPDTFLFVIGQWIAWLPVFQQIYRLYLGYETYCDTEQGKEMKSNNCDKANVTKKNAHAWSIDGNNTFKFEQDRENNELYLRGLFSGQKIHVDVIITGSVKRQITAGQKTYVSPPSSHFWCLCWRRNTSYRKILK